jgi:hypothetical protein
VERQNTGQKQELQFNSIWTLVPKDNGTELQLQHNGFELLEDILTTPTAGRLA